MKKLVLSFLVALMATMSWGQTPTIAWQHTYGGSGMEWLRSSIKTAGGGYIHTGYTDSNDGNLFNIPALGSLDGWIVKTDINGVIQWQKVIGGANWDILGTIIESDGGYVINGITQSNIGDYHGGQDIWVVKIDIDGNILWEQTYGGSGFENVNSLIELSNGNYLVHGYTNSPTRDGDISFNHGGYDIWRIVIDATTATYSLSGDSIRLNNIKH